MRDVTGTMRGLRFDGVDESYLWSAYGQMVVVFIVKFAMNERNFHDLASRLTAITYT
jgi:hypothetical protein